MKPLRCDFCGGQLVMDNSREFAVCEYCGTKYMKETIQDKIQEIRGQVSITGAVETVTGEAEKERILKNAETYIRIKEYDKAIQAYKQVIKQFPEDHRGWWGLYTTPIYCYFATGIFEEAEPNALRNTYNLCKDRSVLSGFYEEIIKRYGAALRLVPTTDKINYALNKISTNALSLDSFTVWLLSTHEKNSIYYTLNFKKFITQLFELIIAGCRDGTVYISEEQYSSIHTNNDPYIDGSSFNTYALVRAIAKLNNVGDGMAPITSDPKSPCYYYVGRNGNYADITQITGIYRRWVYTVNKAGETVALLSSREITRDMIYRLYGRCQHCGGVFKGIINPVCKQCGKKKDYEK